MLIDNCKLLIDTGRNSQLTIYHSQFYMLFSPLPGTPLITQGFGQNPADYAPYGMNGHNGIDFGVPEGTVVYAPHDGTVSVKDHGTKDYGLYVTITDTRRQSVLAHLSAASVQDGAKISQGDVVGKSGKTGDATGPHLHWTFKILNNGVATNKDNGFQGAVDVAELTRLWQDQDLRHNAQYADSAKDYLTLALGPTQQLHRIG